MAEEKNFSFIDDLIGDEKGDDRIWSMAEIDALLSGEDVAGSNKVEDKPVISEKDENGQIGFTQIDIPEEKEEETVEEKKEEPPENQLSFEKTRVFNEIDAGAKFNDKIQHNITNQRVVHTKTPEEENIVGAANKLETDKYRTRFINPPVKNIEKTAEHKALLDSLPPKTIERAGFFVEKGQKTNPTSDLEPVPTLVSAEQIKQRSIIEGAGEEAPEEINENQITFDGFNEKEVIEQVDEYAAESELIKKRREKVKGFKLFPTLDSLEDTAQTDIQDEPEEMPDVEKAEKETAQEVTEEVVEPLEEETDEWDSSEKKKIIKEPEPEIIEREYYGKKDRNAVYELLMKQKRKNLGKVICSAGAEAILIILSALASNGNFVSFANNSVVYLVINLIVLVAVGIICFDTVKNGAKALFKMRAGTDMVVFTALAAAIIQAIVLILMNNGIETKVHLYAAVAVFTLLLNSAGKLVKASQIAENFRFIARKRELFSIHKIDDENEAFEIGRGLFMGDPDIRYSAKIGFPSKFVEMSVKNEPAAYTAAKVTPVVLIASLIIGAATAVVSKDIASGISAFTGTVCLASPVASLLASNLIYSKLAKKLKKDSILISGYEAAQTLAKSNAVVFDAADIFDFGGCDIHGIKLFNSMRIDEAILYTGAVMIEAGGPLANMFRRAVLGSKEMFPTVENLNYEDRLGCSAWVDSNKRVLVGSRDLLINHNVEVPDKEFETKYKQGDRQVIYLAVEHVLSAMFVVSYRADTSVAQNLQRLEKNSLMILVRTTDPNLTEELIENSFSLPRNTIKVISSLSGDMFKNTREKELEKDEAGVLHNGKTENFLKAFNAAYTLMSRIQLSTLLSFIGTGLGIGVMALLSFFSGLNQAGIIQLLVFQIAWSAVSIFIPMVKK